MYIIKHHCMFAVIANKSQMKNCEFISSLKPYDNPQMNISVHTILKGSNSFSLLNYGFSFSLFYKSHTEMPSFGMR